MKGESRVVRHPYAAKGNQDVCSHILVSFLWHACMWCAMRINDGLFRQKRRHYPPICRADISQVYTTITTSLYSARLLRRGAA